MLNIKYLGVTRYSETLALMRDYTDSRDEVSPDELWLLEHEPVFTQGQAGKDEHILCAGDIPVIQSDRGGQITYHGPGQLVCYVLIDIKRAHFGVRDLVDGIEQAVIGLLGTYGIKGHSKKEAPGVYVQESKIAALGLRVRKGRSYHGLSLNVSMDLEPFTRINPCGYEGLQVTDMNTLGINEEMSSVSSRLVEQLVRQFGYDSVP